jgi:hypothetical protein
MSAAKEEAGARFSYKLFADSGCQACGEARITAEQYGRIVEVMHGKDAMQEMLVALQTFLDRYVEMAASGDCGNWDPETEPHVIAARAAIAKATGEL